MIVQQDREEGRRGGGAPYLKQDDYIDTGTPTYFRLQALSTLSWTLGFFFHGVETDVEWRDLFISVKIDRTSVWPIQLVTSAFSHTGVSNKNVHFKRENMCE